MGFGLTGIGCCWSSGVQQYYGGHTRIANLPPPRNKWSRFIPFSSSPQPRPDGVWLNRYWLLLVIGSSAILWLTNKNRKPRTPRNERSRFIPFSSSPQPRPDGVWLNRYRLLLVIGSSAILWLTNKNRKPPPPRNKWSRFIPFSSSPQPRPDGVWLNRYWLLLVIGSSAILWLTNKNRKPRPPPETKGVASLKSHLSVSQHHLYPASPKTPTYFSGPSPSSPKHPPTYFSTPSPSPSSLKPPAYTSKPSSSSTPSSPKPAPSIYFSLSSPSPSSPKRPPVFKSVLCPASSFSNNDDIIQQQRDRKKTAYVCVEEDSLPVFTIPEDIKTLIKNETVPKVLNCSLSPTTYKDYFAALLYSEDFFLEKWSDFLLKAVTLELNEAEIYKNQKKQDKAFVAFELDSVPQNRPFLLSRDLVFARPVGRSTAEPFQGIINRIVRSKTVLVEFEDAFYTHHHSNKKYDVSFSFNRVCLKRAHQAVKDASEDLFQNFLFPHCDSRGSIPTAPALLSTTCHKLDRDQRSAVGHILRIQGSPPYVVTGPDSVPEGKSFAYFREPSRTGVVVSEAVYQLCQKSPEYRILICAPTNSCCDVLMRSLGKVIPESTMFRANAAFREKEEVPEDILRSSLYKESCFSCPPIEELRKYRVIFSTFMSSFRLHDKGIAVGHFSHIFLVDASSAIEPETLVALTNFADKTTSVIVTGKPGNSPRWVRADIARKKGLKISYFERLCKLWPYRSLSPVFITQLDLNQNSGSDYQTAF